MAQKPKSSKTLCGTCSSHRSMPVHHRILHTMGPLPACVRWKLAPCSADEYNRLVKYFAYREDLIAHQLEVVRAELKILNEIDTGNTHPPLSTGHAAAPATPQS